MKKAIITIAVLLITSIALFTYLTGAGNSEEIVLTNLVVGEPAPDFSVVDAYGNTRTLGDFEGKFVILEWLRLPVYKKAL